MTPQRGAMLREMGLGPLWRLRSADAAETGEAVAQVDGHQGLDPAAHREKTHPQIPVQTERVPQRREALDTPPPARDVTAARPPVAAQVPVASVTDTQRSRHIAVLDWSSLESDIRNCSACVLCEKRRQAVPGTGDRAASWMFVGEGPGADEDRLGEPFVGQAGKLLDNMLAALGLSREHEVYIANAVKCRPPHNRTPEADEIAACLPYLKRQIELVKPSLLIALGRPAAKALLDKEISIGAARGKLHAFQGIPVIVTYHPAYLLRNPQDKGKAWEDLCFARRQKHNQ